MKYLLRLLLLFSVAQLTAQGFNQTYDLNLRAGTFSNLSISNDTITLIGVSLDTNIAHNWGITFTQMDTFGNVFWQSSHYTNEDFWSPSNKQGFVKLKNNKGYAIIGTHLVSQRGYLLRLDEKGNYSFLKRYLKGDFFTNYWQHILEAEDGFLVALNKQNLDYDNNCFVFRLDKFGNIQWQISIGDEKYDFVTELTKVSDNEYVLSRLAGINFFNTNQTDDRVQTVITGFDNTGNILWELNTPLDLEEGGARGIQKTANGDWLYASAKPLLIDQNWFAQNKFVRRDSNFNLIWEKEYGFPSWRGGGFEDFKPYPAGGGYVATGYLANGSWQSGYVCRVDDDCNPVWERLDTAYYYPNEAFNILAASDFLASGSIIACGQTRNYDEQKSYGWVLKITPDGCIDTLLCNPIIGTQELPDNEQPTMQVYPNPANDQVHFRSLPMPAGHMEIIDSQGSIRRVVPIAEGQSEWSADVSALPGGVYFYRVISRSGIFKTGRFMVR